MGRKPIYESGAEKHRAHRARKKEDTLSLSTHYSVPVELFSDTERGIVPRPGVTLDQLPDGAYYVGLNHHGIAVKIGATIYERDGLDLLPISLSTAKRYTGTPQNLCRVPHYLQRFYMPQSDNIDA